MLYVIYVTVTAWEQDQDGNCFVSAAESNQFRPDPARKLSENLYDYSTIATMQFQ